MKVKNKNKRSTCRHFKRGTCVYWQKPELCHFPHRPEDAPRLPRLDGDAPPLHRAPPLYPEEATALEPDYQQHSFIPAAHQHNQGSITDPNSGHVYPEYHGDGSQYLGYHLNIDPHGDVSSRPYEYLVLPPPGFSYTEPRLVRADYNPEHGVYYRNSVALMNHVPESHAMPMKVQFGNSHPQASYRPPAYQHQYQLPCQLPDTPPDSRTISPPAPNPTTFSVLSPADGYVTPPLEGYALVDPEKLKRERSKICWYGDDCKRPNCYYRHGVVEGEIKGEASDSPNTGSRKGKEKCNARGLQTPEESSGQGSSSKAKTTAEEWASEEKSSYG
ncbi:hypothetical protein LZ31DRAFT_594155 [Colletotrichum somersetense]|nr:hypothetical protein LZ31DRAFT_594155 [Colletotrichum somersetense]